MLVDEIELKLKAGHGGPGKVSFFPSRNQKAGPDGGNGGRGGDVYVTVTSDLTALGHYANKRQLDAQNGDPGDRNRQSGKAGDDLELAMPIGTELIDTDSGKIIVLDKLDMRVLVCKGGLGGRGNYELRSSRNTTPMKAQSGLPGQERHFDIQLKLIADFGLIGLPNAGKSSLLNELTAANAKIGNYAFTTLEPNLGVFRQRIIADIPGLIEGASEGKGLGIKFLKHIEKVRLLLHCIAADSDNVVRDYKTVYKELKNYNPELVEKEEIILLTKIDLVDEAQVKKQVKALKSLKRRVIPVSIHNWESIEGLSKHMYNSKNEA